MAEPSKIQKKRDRNEAIRWARQIIESPEKYCILDTETTGLKKDDVIIQLAIIAPNGGVLMDSFVSCDRSIPRAATEIHGITKKMLKGAPSMSELLDDYKRIVKGKTIVTYNAAFDGRMLQQTIGQIKNRNDKFHGTLNCAMEAYGLFQGEWDSVHGHYKWHKLKGGDHSALGDCKATLKLIEQMANSELEEVPGKTAQEVACELWSKNPLLWSLFLLFIVAMLYSMFSQIVNPVK